MDIRNFFGGSGAVKPKKTESVPVKQKAGPKAVSDLTKLKSDKDKHKVESEHFKTSKEKHVKVKERDENGNKSSEKSKEKSKSKTKAKTDDKHTKDKKKFDSEEVIAIDDDFSSQEEKKGKEKSKKQKKKSLSPNKDETDGDVITKNRGMKRKKHVSATDEEEINIIEDSDDDIVVKKSARSKKRGKKMQRILDSDSDEEPFPKDKKSRKSRKKEHVPVHIGGDVDENIISPPKKAKTFMDNFLSKTPQKSPQKVKPSSDKKKEEKKEVVNACDFFGSTAIHRVERKVTEAVKNTVTEEEDMEIHSDEEFERTLELLDEDMTSIKNVPEKEKKKDSPTKPSINEGTSLASKLASKVKGHESPEKKQKLFVADTPDVKKPSPKKQISPKRAKMEFVASRPDKKSPDKPSPSKTENTGNKTAATPKQEQKKTSPNKMNSETGTPGGTPRGGPGYKSYLNRAAPQALGSKEIPEGAENCLEGLTFVITGVLESMERDDCKSLVERYGGKVTGNVSKKTDYLVAGRDAGLSKIAKAESFKTKQLDEDGILELIRTKPGKKSKYTIQAEASVKKEASLQKTTSVNKLEQFKKESVNTNKLESFSKVKEEPSNTSNQSESVKIQMDQSGPSLLWVDKYKPTQLKQIIGQSGDKSNCKKLLHWLTNWHKNQAVGVKPPSGGKFFGRGGSDDGAGFKAALLSGPPGIGKTTTATLVCQEAGFSFVELNASDTRNAKSLKEEVAQAVGNTSMVDYIDGSAMATQGHKHCLIMDEVDGMSGNQDRGGISELVNIIKHSRIPIITMCNDRNHLKMRTLSNHCFDLRFQRPRVEQIKAAVMSIAFKEGLKVPPPALNEIILASNQDIRQVIHNLSMFTAADKAVTYDQAKSDAQQAKKDMKMGPFDVCRKVFVGGAETAGMTLNDKSDLYFHDYNIAPLFVQENYPSVSPFAARGSMSRHLSLLARTADSLSDADLVDKQVRINQAWSLLPTAAMYASVLPGEYMRGNMSGMIAFPSWLGKNSSTGKSERILQELRTHMRLQISGDKRALNQDYLPYLRTSLTEPLVVQEGEGVKDVLALMDNYDIIKDDFDNIMDITKWPNSSDPLSQLSTKTKAAFTRTYNKEAHMTPYSTGVTTKKKRGGGGAAGGDNLDLLGEEGEGDEGGQVEEEEEDKDDLDMDSMIKKKTASKKSTASVKGKGKTEGKGKAAAKGTTKGKGKGKGKT